MEQLKVVWWLEWWMSMLGNMLLLAFFDWSGYLDQNVLVCPCSLLDGVIHQWSYWRVVSIAIRWTLRSAFWALWSIVWRAFWSTVWKVFWTALDSSFGSPFESTEWRALCCSLWRAICRAIGPTKQTTLWWLDIYPLVGPLLSSLANPTHSGCCPNVFEDVLHGFITKQCGISTAEAAGMDASQCLLPEGVHESLVGVEIYLYILYFMHSRFVSCCISKWIIILLEKQTHESLGYLKATFIIKK